MSQSPKFLYVEDDEFSRTVIRTLIERVLGYSDITFFDDSANFEERLHQLPEKPDLIFLDIQMDPYDGYEVLKMIRADEEYKEITTIAMTANVMATDVKNLKEAGFDGLIGKPIDRSIFPQLIEEILNGESVWYVS